MQIGDADVVSVGCFNKSSGVPFGFGLVRHGKTTFMGSALRLVRQPLDGVQHHCGFELTLDGGRHKVVRVISAELVAQATTKHLMVLQSSAYRPDRAQLLDVWSRNLVVWIDGEPGRLFRPGFADRLVRREAA